MVEEWSRGAVEQENNLLLFYAWEIKYLEFFLVKKVALYYYLINSYYHQFEHFLDSSSCTRLLSFMFCICVCYLIAPACCCWLLIQSIRIFDYLIRYVHTYPLNVHKCFYISPARNITFIYCLFLTFFA